MLINKQLNTSVKRNIFESSDEKVEWTITLNGDIKSFKQEQIIEIEQKLKDITKDTNFIITKIEKNGSFELFRQSPF